MISFFADLEWKEPSNLISIMANYKTITNPLFFINFTKENNENDQRSPGYFSKMLCKDRTNQKRGQMDDANICIRH